MALHGMISAAAPRLQPHVSQEPAQRALCCLSPYEWPLEWDQIYNKV